jgi:hypothetical protein
MADRGVPVGMALELGDVLGRLVVEGKLVLVNGDADQHAQHGLGDRGGGEAVAGRAAVLVALGEDGVALEDEQPGVGMRVEELVEQLLERGGGRGALELARLGGFAHAARRMELVHAAPDVDELAVGVRGCESTRRRQQQNCAKQPCLF